MADEDRVEEPESGDAEQQQTEEQQTEEQQTEAATAEDAPQGAGAEGAEPEPEPEPEPAADAGPDPAGPDEVSEEAVADAGEPGSVTREDAARVAAASPDTGGEAAVTPEAADAAQAADSPGTETPGTETPGPAPEAGKAEAGSRSKPEIPGADLEPDIVLEEARRARGEVSEDEDPYAHLVEDEDGEAAAEDAEAEQTITQAAIDLASGATYSATGKRKNAVARVILRPGNGEYRVNDRELETAFPRVTLRRAIRMPLETVGYETRMDVVAKLHGGGISAQAIALRHGIARALIDADPNLRGELKKRGFLTRDQRVKERKKAGLKKARKRPQFSKR